MWKKAALGLLVLFSFTYAHPLAAATFYVDNSGSPPCGDVPTNGTEANPWCTISYGASRTSGGDTLYVKNGTYANPGPLLNSTHSGTESNPTVVAAFPGHAPVIQGAGVHTGRVRIDNASHARMEGFTITSVQDGIFIHNSSNIVFRRNTIHDVGQVCIGVQKNSSFVTVEDNVCFNTGLNTGEFGEGIYVGTGSRGLLDNTNNVTVRRNTVHDTTDEGIELKPGTHDNIVEGNLLYNISTPFGPTVGAIEVSERNAGNQSWTGNPSHIIRDNIVHSSVTAIRLGTGSTAYNNVIYNIQAGHYGIYANNSNGDSFTRFIYHNTVDLSSSNAIVVAGGTTDVKNNIGSSTTNNVATSDSFYVNKTGADYHLAPGSAPINAGLDLTGIVPTDIEGKSRLTQPPPALGAYEFGGAPPLEPPTNLRVIVR